MNTQKVVVGGLAAGVVIFILDFASNFFLLGDRWQAEMTALNPALAANMESTGAMVGYIVLDLLFGLELVWLYAAIRSRFGPGARTATIAALYFWIFTGTVYAGLAVMGMVSWTMYAMGAATWLLIALVGANVGCRLYSE